MLRRYLTLLLLGCMLLLLPAAHGEITLSASSSLDTFSYDLDSIHIKLEKLNARWQLSPLDNGRLQVEQLKAKRLTITLHDTDKKSQNTALPKRISLPFPVSIKHAEIEELAIITPEGRQVLNHVQFDFSGNASTLRLNLTRAATAWGDATGILTMGTVRPFGLSGTVAIKQTDSDIPYDTEAQIAGDLQTLTFESSVVLAKQEQTLQVMRSSSDIGNVAARISASGQLRLSDDFPMTIHAQVTALQPERLGRYPAGMVNLDFDLDGKLQPKAAFNLRFAAKDSLLQGQPLTASGNIALDDWQIRNIDMLANIGNNTLKANGSLGQENGRLDWQANLNDLRILGAGFSGTVLAEGSLAGSFDNLALHLKLLAQQLQLPGDVAIEKLQGQAELAAGGNGVIAGEFDMNNIRYGTHAPLNGRMMLSGTRDQHKITVTAQNDMHHIESTLQGTLSSVRQWHGWLQTLTYSAPDHQAAASDTAKTGQGIDRITLQSPAPLRLDDKGLTLDNAVLLMAHGQADIDLLQISSRGFTSRGRLGHLAFNELHPERLALLAALQGDLIFSGTWDINAADSLNGKLDIWRESGDLKFTDSTGTVRPLGLNEAKSTLAITDNQVALNSTVSGTDLGSINIRLGTRLTTTDSGYTLAGSAPFTLDSTAQLRTLAWLPLSSSAIQADVDGQLDLAVKANGTLGAPNLSGYANARQLQFSLPFEGVVFSNGTLEATFAQNKLNIKQASWHGGAGSLRTSGFIVFEQAMPKIELDWTADKFTVISRADRLLTLSGSGKTLLADNMLSILGNFTIEKGLLELANENVPELGDDVVLVGEPESAAKTSTMVLLNGLHVDLGKDFTLRGRGLDAQLIGALTFTGLTEYHPHTEGSIQVKRGTYMAYGQVLNIERGIFNFSGVIDNPGLNIRAMRNSKPINAGIEITGSAFLPMTKLVSDPEVPDSEKLSWLVLGHGMATAGKNDYGMLSLAAGALLSQGQSIPLQTQIARAAGLDEFSFAGGDPESAALVFGKRLTSQLYLSYEKSISGLLDVARLTFNITPRWSLRAEAGTESAVDVLYTFSFK